MLLNATISSQEWSRIKIKIKKAQIKATNRMFLNTTISSQEWSRIKIEVEKAQIKETWNAP